MFGVLNIDKPAHCTSHDVVARVRKVFNLKKVGHCGTLDPLAEGVLPICLGNATRLIEYFADDKRYRAQVTFGITTNTLDAEGEELSNIDASHLTRGDISLLLPQFTGTIIQEVPQHAAVHVNGKKLYEYARKGIEVTLPTRETYVADIQIVDWTTIDPAHPTVVLDIHCSTGTYVRAMAKAIGEAVGTGAYLSHLTRTAHGRFNLQDSVSLQTLMNSPHPGLYLQSPVPYLDMPICALTDDALNKIAHGMKLQPEDLPDEAIRQHQTYLLVYGDDPVAIAKGEPRGRLKPLKVFVTPETLPSALEEQLV